jgi:hypothetical protein
MTISVTMRPDKRRAPKPRLQVRRLFGGELAAGTLRIARGCHETAIDREGNVIRDREPDASRRLLANVGDRLMTWGRIEPDEVAILEVTGIQQNGWDEQLAVQVLVGEVSDGHVQVMKAHNEPRIDSKGRVPHVEQRHAVTAEIRAFVARMAKGEP